MGTQLDATWQDLRYALRIFRKTPVVTSVALLSLALGIGANTAIFTLIDKVALRTLPVNRPQELMQVLLQMPQSPREPSQYVSNAIWEQIRDRQDIFSGVFSWFTTQFDLQQGGEAHYVQGLWVSGDFFNTLGVGPVVGRVFNPNDDKPGCPPMAVLSYGFWKRYYNGERGVVGRVLPLNTHGFEITGVAPSGFFGVEVGKNFDVAVPLCAEPIIEGKSSMLQDRSEWWLHIIGRRKAGLLGGQVNARLQMLSPEVFAAVVPPDWNPQSQQDYRHYSLAAVPAASGISSLRAAYDRPLELLMGVVALVLLIASANIASLMLSRAAARRKEIAVRLAVGAHRRRLIRQLLTESILLSCCGALLGVLLGRWLSALLISYISSAANPVSIDLSLDARMLSFTAAVAIFTGLLFGVLPAFKSTRISLAATMRSGQTDTGRYAPNRWIVSLQTGLSLVLLVIAGLFLHSFVNLLTLDAGFDPSNILLVYLHIRNAGVSDSERAVVYEQILERVRLLPQVISASQSVATPIGGDVLDGHVYPDQKEGLSAFSANTDLNYVTPDYFATLRTPLLEGRDFNRLDTANNPEVAIINQALAHRFFPQDNPVGKYIRQLGGSGNRSPAMEVIGVIKDAKYESLRQAAPPTVYFPLAQWKGLGQTLIIEIRTASRPSSLMRAVESAIAGVNKGISLDFRTLEEQLDASLRQDRLLARLSGFFGALALLLATVGLYGVLSYMVTQRQREISVRMSLGAQSLSILRMILKDVVVVLAAGLTLGVSLALVASRFLERMLYQPNVYAAETIILAAVILAMVELFAGYIPARRAARLDPMVILRDQ